MTLSRFLLIGLVATTAAAPLHAQQPAPQPRPQPAQPSRQGPPAQPGQPSPQGQTAQATPERVTVTLTDPSRPATLEIGLVTGSIVVRAADRRDILVEARPRVENRRRDADTAAGGLRRLAQVAGFAVEENDNRVEIESQSISRGIDFEIVVPTRTNLHLSTVNSGDITVTGVDGDLEIENTNGSVTLTGVSGSVVAHTVNGQMRATLTRVTAQKAMAFTSLNGAVDVTLPASVRATLKLRSDQGDVFTDFDLQLRAPEPAATTDAGRSQRGRYRVEVNKAIYGTVNGGGPEIEMRTFNGNVYVRKGS